MSLRIWHCKAAQSSIRTRQGGCSLKCGLEVTLHEAQDMRCSYIYTVADHAGRA